MLTTTHLGPFFASATPRKMAALSLFVFNLISPAFGQSEARRPGSTSSIEPGKLGPSNFSIPLPPGSLVTVGGTHLWVEPEGDGEAALVLLGVLENEHVSFSPYFSAVAKRFKIVSYDYRGMGRNDRSNRADGNIQADVEDLEALRQKLASIRYASTGIMVPSSRKHTHASFAPTLRTSSQSGQP